MATVNVHEAKTNFSRILSRVESGEEIIIAKAGTPVAQIGPIRQKVKKRSPGSAKGRIVMKDSFFDPLPAEMIREFEK